MNIKYYKWEDNFFLFLSELLSVFLPRFLLLSLCHLKPRMSNRCLWSAHEWNFVVFCVKCCEVFKFIEAVSSLFNGGLIYSTTAEQEASSGWSVVGPEHLEHAETTGLLNCQPQAFRSVSYIPIHCKLQYRILFFRLREHRSYSY